MGWAYFLGSHFRSLGAFSNPQLSPKILPSGAEWESLQWNESCYWSECDWAYEHGEGRKRKVEYHLETCMFFFKPLKNGSNRHRVINRSFKPRCLYHISLSLDVYIWIYYIGICIMHYLNFEKSKKVLITPGSSKTRSSFYYLFIVLLTSTRLCSRPKSLGIEHTVFHYSFSLWTHKNSKY